jgi:hypothetical protein
MASGRAALARTAILAAILAAGAACAPGSRVADDEAAVRVERAVDDARDPVERGGERGVPRSGQALDEHRTRAE